MKKSAILTAILCLCFQAVTVLAQTSDYSGVWELDISKSKLPEAVKIDSMSLKVWQTAKEIKVETATRTSITLGDGSTKQANATRTVAYNLDGTETTAELGDGVMAISESKKAKMLGDGKLSLTVTRGSKTDASRPAMKSNENWELLDNGQTLKIVRYTESARGGTNWELYFTKKSGVENAAMTNNAVESTAPAPTANGEAVRIGTSVAGQINGGVLNGKAVSFPKPAYPAAARAVRASGAVSVQVTVDEAGDVISASAVSGHPLLRQAAEEAARQAKFTPTTLSGQPVKITGVIVYNFVP